MGQAVKLETIPAEGGDACAMKDSQVGTNPFQIFNDTLIIIFPIILLDLQTI